MNNDQLGSFDYGKAKLASVSLSFGTCNHDNGDEPPTDNHNCGQQQRYQKYPLDEVFSQFPPPGQSGDFRAVLPHVALTAKLPPASYLLLLNEADFDQQVAKKPTFMPLAELRQGAIFPRQAFKPVYDNLQFDGVERMINTVDVKKLFLDTLLLADLSQTQQLSYLRRCWQLAKQGWSEKTIDINALTCLGKGMLSDIRRELSLPPSVKSIVVVKPGHSWVAKDSLQGDSLLEVVSKSKHQAKLQRSTLLDEHSVLLANRFAQVNMAEFPNGLRHYALVVSLQHYDKNSDVIEHAQDQDFVRLVVHSSWWFNCTLETTNFAQQAGQISVDALDLSAQNEAQRRHFLAAKNDGLAAPSFTQVEQFSGWYKGPLLPSEGNAVSKQAWQLDDGNGPYGVDRLLGYYDDQDKFDISYGAAYELGRLLSSNNKTFRQALAKYQRVTMCQQKFNVAQQLRRDILDLPDATLTQAPLTEQFSLIEEWLLSLAQFKQIPSWYLIADLQLLPKQSIRRFKIDPKWIKSLWLGALSIDGRPQATTELFKRMYRRLLPKLPKHGVVLRSNLVWAYPALTVKLRQIKRRGALTTEQHRGFQRIVDVKACQFEDSLSCCARHSSAPLTHDTRLYTSTEPFNYVSLSLPKECLHYGASLYPNEQALCYRKQLAIGGRNVLDIAIDFSDSNKAIFNANRLAAKMMDNLNTLAQSDVDGLKTALRASRFGQLMIEYEPKVAWSNI